MEKTIKDLYQEQLVLLYFLKRKLESLVSDYNDDIFSILLFLRFEISESMTSINKEFEKSIRCNKIFSSVKELVDNRRLSLNKQVEIVKSVLVEMNAVSDECKDLAEQVLKENF